MTALTLYRVCLDEQLGTEYSVTSAVAAKKFFLTKYNCQEIILHLERTAVTAKKFFFTSRQTTTTSGLTKLPHLINSNLLSQS